MKKRILLLTVIIFMMAFTVASAKEFDKQYGIELDKVWKVNMSEAVLAESVPDKIMISEGPDTVELSTTVEGKTIYVKANDLFKPNTEYLMKIETGIESLSGKKLKEHVQMYFHTINEKPTDEEPPEVITDIFKSDYDFDWQYDRNQSLTLTGVQNGEVVAGFTMDPAKEPFGIKIGDAREYIARKLGGEVDYIQREHYKQPVLDFQKEVVGAYLVDDHYVYVHYDNHLTGSALGIQWVDKKIEYDRDYWYTQNTEAFKKSQELLMFELINESRIYHGLPLLTMDEKVREVARNHSLDMAQKNYFSHTSLEGETVRTRLTKTGYQLIWIGENISKGHASSIESHVGLMNSLGHRNNILSENYTHVGVGVEIGEDLSPYYTINFISKK